jgi:hypothetical protein
MLVCSMHHIITAFQLVKRMTSLLISVFYTAQDLRLP